MTDVRARIKLIYALKIYITEINSFTYFHSFNSNNKCRKSCSIGYSISWLKHSEMILSSTIPVTKNQLKLISVFIHVPIAIVQDEKNQSVFITSKQPRRKERHLLKVQLLSIAIYSVFLFFNGLWYLQSPKLQTDQKVLVALISFCIPGVAFVSVSSWYDTPEDLASLLNMQLVYERGISKAGCREAISYANFLKWSLQIVGMGGTTAIQIFLVLLIFVKPDTPPFLGSIVSGN